MILVTRACEGIAQMKEVAAINPHAIARRKNLVGLRDMA